MWLFWLIVVLVIIFVILKVYLKLKHRFWSMQPVYHVYDWHKHFQLIQPELPLFNRYVNHINIKTRLASDLTPSEGERIAAFIGRYYIWNHRGTHYRPPAPDILAYLQNEFACITQYTEPKWLLQQSSTTLTQTDELIGLLTARPLNMHLNFKMSTVTHPVELHYIDHLCIKADRRTEGIAPELIQTHFYDLRRLQNRSKVCLFKREGQLMPLLRPLCQFTTSCFDVSATIEASLPIGLGLVEFSKTNMHMLEHFWRLIQSQFTCCVIMSTADLLQVLNAGVIKVYGLVQNGQVVAVYVFRRLALVYEDNRNSGESICVTKHSELGVKPFFTGFMTALNCFKKAFHIHYLLVETTADGQSIVSGLMQSKHLRLAFESPTAFYLYNYAMPTVKAHECMFIY